jgi:ABC-2 type transport system permease protein
VRYLRIVWQCLKASAQQSLAYRSNFFISLLHTGLNFGTSILALVVLFGQVEAMQGWTFPATLALLGVYGTVGALRGLFIGPSLDALAGLNGEVWTGRFDFTLLRPINAQFLASFRYWRVFALIDLVLGLATLGVAVSQLQQTFSFLDLLAFLTALTASILVLYAILLTFTALVFWSPGFLFTWLFDSIFQMARYPVGLYPGWLQLLLTWVVPVGVMTTVPAEALAGEWSGITLFGSVVLALAAVAGASVLFRSGLRRYVSASS